MKQEISRGIAVPSEIHISKHNSMLILKKGNISSSKAFIIPNVEISIDNNKVNFKAKKGSKRELKVIMASIAHIKNMIGGLDKEYTYNLQAVNVHFPMTLKVEGQRLAINNFLGEKKSRYAKILQGVKVEVKGQNVTVKSHDKELAGQTAANIEKATRVRNRDRRVFQDGIYITSKAQQEDN